MSKNRRYQRAIKLPKRLEAEIRHDKTIAGQIYYTFKNGEYPLATRNIG